MKEKVLFLSQIFETAFLLKVHVLGPPESQNYILSSLSVCEPVINTTQKQMMAGTSNLVF